MASSVIKRSNPFDGMMKYEHNIVMNHTDLIIEGAGNYQTYFLIGQSAIMGTVMSKGGTTPDENLSSPSYVFTVTAIDSKTLRVHFSHSTSSLQLSVYSYLDFALSQETP